MKPNPKPMKSRIFFTLLLLSTLAFSCGFQGEHADMIVHNANIYSIDDQFHTYEAMAIRDGKILALGSEREILNKYNTEVKIDAAQQFIYPGLIDAHCHFYGYGLSAIELDLTGTRSWDECLQRIKTYASQHQGSWINGRGWDQNDWDDQEYPTNKELNKLFPETPVFLRRIDGHAAIANNIVLEMAKIQNTTNIVGGELIKDEDGVLTGLLIDNGMNPVYQIKPLPRKQEIMEALLRAQQDCFAVGLTTVDDAGLNISVIRIMDELQKTNKLKMRIYAMLAPEEGSLEQLKKGIIKTERMNVRSVKLYGDGSLGSRGACLKENYHDLAGHQGAMIRTEAFYNQWAQYCRQYGFQLNTHCIGDSSNITLLRVYGEHIKDATDLRWRVEHAQVVTPGDRHFFADYGIIPSVQPTHATSDMYWAEDRLGNERMEGAYAYQSLLQEMGIVALGTDFPVEDISPIKTFYAAVARKDSENYPENGFRMKEALTRKQALMGMTIWAAMANFEEEEKGSLEVGKQADFVILDRDLMKAPEDQLLKTKVYYTYIHGEQVYKR